MNEQRFEIKDKWIYKNDFYMAVYIYDKEFAEQFIADKVYNNIPIYIYHLKSHHIFEVSSIGRHGNRYSMPSVYTKSGNFFAIKNCAIVMNIKMFNEYYYLMPGHEKYYECNFPPLNDGTIVHEFHNSTIK